MSRQPASYAICVILIHLAVSLVHGLAHTRLGISLNATQTIFVGTVITLAPLVAGYLLWTNKLRAGGTLLAASMIGALVFGVYYHFIASGADNVHHRFPLGSANWKERFDQTAAEIAVLEALGIILGCIVVLKSRGKASKATSE